MSNVRKPRAKHEPKTLAELVIDLDERLEGGDALSDVWVPHEEWAAFCEQALEERDGAQPQTGELFEAAAPTGAGEWAKGFVDDSNRQQLARALGAGVDTELADLVEIATGYAMALDIERERALDRLQELAEARAPRASAKTPEEAPGPTIVERANKDRADDCARRLNGAGWRRRAKKARAENSPSDCHHCGAGSCDDTGGLSSSFGGSDGVPHGTFCTECLSRLRENPREWDRHAASSDADAGRRGPLQAYVSTYAVGPLHKDRNTAVAWMKGEGHRSFSVKWANGDICDVVELPPLAPKKTKGKKKPTKPEERVASDEERAADREDSRRGKEAQQTIEDALARKDAASPSKPVKFPKGTGATEECTVCTREQGMHDGTRCPEEMHGAMVPLAGANKRRKRAEAAL